MPIIIRMQEKPTLSCSSAALIAAVRLNREEIKSSPVVYKKIADCIRLAEMIQARLRG
jgi:hypothetical protein